jgi:hypothetical protein
MIGQTQAQGYPTILSGLLQLTRLTLSRNSFGAFAFRQPAGSAPDCT